MYKLIYYIKKMSKRRRLQKEDSLKISTKGDYKLLKIDSAFRRGGDPGDFSFTPNADVRFKCAKLLSVEIPNSIYSISDNRETTTLQVNQNGTLIQVNLLEGNYTAEELRVELENQLNLALLSNGLYTVTYNKNTASLTITNTVIIDLLFSQSGNIHTVLGFNYEDTGFLLSHTSSNVIDLSGPKYLFIDINPLPSGPRIISGNGTSGVFVFPMRAPFGTINYFEAEGLGYELVASSSTKHNLRNIRVVVRDEYGNIPDLSLDWSMLLRLE